MSDPIVTSSTTTTAPIEHWRREVEALMQDARHILERVTTAQRIYNANNIGAQIESVSVPSHAVPGTSMSAARALALASTVQAVATFMDTVVDQDTGLTVQDVLYRMWEPGIETE